MHRIQCGVWKLFQITSLPIRKKKKHWTKLSRIDNRLWVIIVPLLTCCYLNFGRIEMRVEHVWKIRHFTWTGFYECGSINDEMLISGHVPHITFDLQCNRISKHIEHTYVHYGDRFKFVCFAAFSSVYVACSQFITNYCCGLFKLSLMSS